MSNFPDFERQGYQVIQKLGHNYQGGRLTYKAISLDTQQPVVIKQFRFATASSDWSDNKAVEREIQVLRSLNHPGIPRYLDFFHPGDEKVTGASWKSDRVPGHRNQRNKV